MEPRHSQGTEGTADRGNLRAQIHAADRCRAVAQVLSRVGDKWSVMIIMSLGDETLRFSALKRSIGGISQRMLTLTLRGLERDGLVSRTAFPSIPPRVEYTLTELGHSLRSPVEELGRWAFENEAVVARARDDYDEREL